MTFEEDLEGLNRAVDEFIETLVAGVREWWPRGIIWRIAVVEVAFFVVLIPIWWVTR